MISNDFFEKYKKVIGPEGQQLVFEFMITYARFECALKATNDFVRTDDKQVAYANWVGYSKSISYKFNKNRTQELSEAAGYLLDNPPKMQVLVGYYTEWTDRIIPDHFSDCAKLFWHISDVRNNLLHGGKFNGNYQPETSRNFRLIKSSLIVLNEFISLNEEVKSNFSANFQ